MSHFMLSIHAHFYQPPRAHPLTGTIGSERGAAPYRNWNERATEEVYRPNAKLGNFEQLSFDMGEDLLVWLATHATETYHRVTGGVHMVQRTDGVGNVVASPIHQCPLPSLPRQDRLTQLRWGRDATEARFGYRPAGVFLPFFAVDMPTLEDVAEAGFAYTILPSSQVSGLKPRGGAGPYRVSLPNGKSVLVFVSDDGLSRSLAEEMAERGGSGHWARGILASHVRKAGPLTLLCIGGELIGQHHMAEATFLRYLLSYEAPAVAFQPITLEQYYRRGVKPIGEIEIIPTVIEEVTDFQKTLCASIAALQAEAGALFEKSAGKDAWKIRDLYFTGRPVGDIGAWLEAQLCLQRAMANAMSMEYYPQQLNNIHIFSQVAHAVVLMQQYTQIDLMKIFTDGLSEMHIAAFVKQVEEMQTGLLVKAGTR